MKHIDHEDASVWADHKQGMVAANATSLRGERQPRMEKCGFLTGGLAGLRAHFVFDTGLRIHRHDCGAEWMMKNAIGGLSVAGRTLVLGSVRANALLGSYLRDPQRLGASTLELPLDMPSLRAHVGELASRAAHSSESQFLLAVSGASTARNYIAMGMRLGLSPAEAGLLDALCTDSSLASYAQARGVALSTVRVQMRAVLRKLSVHTQLEAVRMMLRQC